ncbi:MAG: hypothetical protein OWQ48_05990 [Desulfurococcus sp.]|nr:hypothetical protein [Desulfurococcus sp.]
MLRFDEKVLAVADAGELAEFIEEASALNHEYVKACGDCGGEKVCLYLHLKAMDEEVFVELAGFSIEAPHDRILDDRILGILRYASTIVSRSGLVEFYVNGVLSIGVHRLVCKSRVKVSEAWFLEYEEFLAMAG